MQLFLRVYNAAFEREGFVMRWHVMLSLHAWSPSAAAGEVTSAWHDETGRWHEMRATRVLHRTIRCHPHRPACEPVQLAWEDGLSYESYQYRVRLMPSSVGDGQAPEHHPGARPLPIGKVEFVVRRDAAGWTSLGARLGLSFGALSLATLVFACWQFAGVGSLTPQQRILPFAIAGAMLYVTDGLSALLFLTAPSSVGVSWSVARVASKGVSLSLATFHALVELHAHGFDDLSPHTPSLRHTSSGRAFSTFWLPKLLLTTSTAALSVALWGGFVLASQGVEARSHGEHEDQGMAAYMLARDQLPLTAALSVLVGMTTVYYFGVLAWVALRAISTRRLRQEHRARFAWQAAGSTVFLCLLIGSEAAHPLLEYLSLVGWVSEADGAREADATCCGYDFFSPAAQVSLRVMQVLLFTGYYVLQAVLFVPSSGMRALRMAERLGVDLQAGALAALLPSLADQIHATGRPLGTDRPTAEEEQVVWCRLRERLDVLSHLIAGEQALQQAEAESAAASSSGFFGRFQAHEKGVEARQLRGVVADRIHGLSLLVREIGANPLRARDQLLPHVLSRLNELEGAAAAGQPASPRSSSLVRDEDSALVYGEVAASADGEVPAWMVAPLLGTQMVVDQCTLRVHAALCGLHSALMRLQELLAIKRVKQQLASYLRGLRSLSRTERALFAFLSHLLELEHLPLPYGLQTEPAAAESGGGDAGRGAHAAHATGRAIRHRMGLFRRYGEWLPWAAAVRGRDASILSESAWLDALAVWLDALHEHDCAVLGHVTYAALPPAQLAEAAQAEWRRAILEASPLELQRIRPFLLTRPELARMAEGIEGSQARNACISATSTSLYRYAILLKDMSGYTIESCPERARWRSRTVQLGMLPVGRSVHSEGKASGVWLRNLASALRRRSISPPALEDRWYLHFVDFEEQSRPTAGAQRGDDFAIEFGGASSWAAAGEGPLGAKIIETDAQLWLQLWLHGALQRSGDDYEELRRIRRRLRDASRGEVEAGYHAACHAADERSDAGSTSDAVYSPGPRLRVSRAFRSPSPLASPLPSPLASPLPSPLRSPPLRARDPRVEMGRACRALEPHAAFAVTLRVLRFGPLGAEELLGTARWIPPWRHPSKLIDEQEGDGEDLDETARRIRADWLRRATPRGSELPSDESSDMEVLPVLSRSGDRVGSLHVIIRAADAFRVVCASMEGGVESAAPQAAAHTAEAEKSAGGGAAGSVSDGLPSSGGGTAAAESHTSGCARARNGRPKAEGGEGGTERYVLRAHSAPWEELEEVLAAVLTRRTGGGMFSMGANLPEWFLQLRRRVDLGRERPQQALVLELATDQLEKLTAGLEARPALRDVTLTPCLGLEVRP